MECPNCHRENEPNSRFCIFCGSLLPAPEAGHPSESVENPEGTSLRQLQAVQGEVRRLSETVELMNRRLAALEGMHGAAQPSPQPKPVPPEVIVTPTTEAASISSSEARPAKAKEWEQILGGNWLARIGVLALIIGVAFLVKLAADRN